MRIPRTRGFAAAVVIFTLTLIQLAVGAFAGLDQFDGKGFGYRLIAYPLLMLIVPAIWLWRTRERTPVDELPWGAFALIMAPFLVDVSGNTVDLYDTIDWWDNANHFVNWMLLLWGCGLLLRLIWSGPTWALVHLGTLGALVAALIVGRKGPVEVREPAGRG